MRRGSRLRRVARLRRRTATNVNHGGTPGLSRYATWFIPLAIPLFQELTAGSPAASPGWRSRPRPLPSSESGRSTLPGQRRSISRRHSRRSCGHGIRRFDNPLPEIFAERLRGLDENWLPIATPGCEKVLLPGRGGRDSVWPMPCAPVTPPARCQQPGATCYANRTKTGTSSQPARLHAPGVPPARSATWPLSAGPFVEDALTSLAWWNMTRDRSATTTPHRVVPPRRPRRRVGGGEPVLRLRRRRPARRRVGGPGHARDRGSLTVESGPIEGARVRIRPGLAWQAIRLPSPQPWVTLVAEAWSWYGPAPRLPAPIRSDKRRRFGGPPSQSGEARVRAPAWHPRALTDRKAMGSMNAHALAARGLLVLVALWGGHRGPQPSNPRRVDRR